LKIQLQIF